MKKIVFVLSILCFMAVMNVNAQIVVPGKKAPDAPQNVGKSAAPQLSKAELRQAIKKADAAPDMIVEKRGNETIFLRRVADSSNGRQYYTRVAYIPKSGKFIDLQEVESPANKKDGEGLVPPTKRSPFNQRF